MKIDESPLENGQIDPTQYNIRLYFTKLPAILVRNNPVLVKRGQFKNIQDFFEKYQCNDILILSMGYKSDLPPDAQFEIRYAIITYYLQ